tara:strand:+ start:6492 stop:6938 length:447 start_codon:yes stop_codon:yes gene_type:complete
MTNLVNKLVKVLEETLVCDTKDGKISVSHKGQQIIFDQLYKTIERSILGGKYYKGVHHFRDLLCTMHQSAIRRRDADIGTDAEVQEAKIKLDQAEAQIKMLRNLEKAFAYLRDKAAEGNDEIELGNLASNGTKPDANGEEVADLKVAS